MDSTSGGRDSDPSPLGNSLLKSTTGHCGPNANTPNHGQVSVRHSTPPVDLTSGRSGSITPPSPRILQALADIENNTGAPVADTQSSAGTDRGTLSVSNALTEVAGGHNKVVDFEPYKMLHKTAIKVECGPQLEAKYTVHLELLSCFSQDLSRRFSDTTAERQAWEAAKQIKAAIKCWIFPHSKEFQRSEAANFLIRCFKRYPLPLYQSEIRKAILDRADELLKTRAMTSLPLSDKSFPKKNQLSAFDIETRLNYLSVAGIEELTKTTYEYLVRIKTAYQKSAISSKIRAAAQHRMILPEYKCATVEAWITWMYDGSLQINTPSILCSLYALAHELGITDLAETCMSKLSVAVSDEVKATHNGVQSLLLTISDTTAECSDADGSTLHAIFKHVRDSKNSPAAFRKLIVHVLSFGGTKESYLSVEKILSESMRSEITCNVFDRLLEYLAQYPGVERPLVDRLSFFQNDSIGPQSTIDVKCETTSGDRSLHTSATPDIKAATVDQSIVEHLNESGCM